MSQLSTKVSSGGVLVLALTLPQHVVSFTLPTPYGILSYYSCYKTQPPPRQQSELYSSTPISLDNIMENPTSFPNTSRMIRALSQDNSAGDYREFLTSLSREWMQYSSNAEQNYLEESWIDRNVGSSSKKIATAVGTASGYATTQGLNYMHHHEAYMLAQNNPAETSGEHQFASAANSYGEEHFASAAADSSSHYSVFSNGGYEPHPYMSQDYHYGESSPNLLRDLAKSLPQPEDYSDAAPSYHGYDSYYDDSLHYIAGPGMDAGGTSDVSNVAISASSLSAEVPNAASEITNSLSSQLSDIAYSQSFGHAETESKRFSVPQVSKAMEPPNANEAVTKAKEFAAHSAESINHALAQAKETGSSQFNHLLGSVSHSFDGFPEKIASVGSSGAESFGKVASEMQKVQIPSFDTSKLPKFDVSAMPTVDMSKVKMPPAPLMPSVDVSKVKMQSVPFLPAVKSNVVPAESLSVEGSKAAPSIHVNFADNSLSDIGNSIFGGIKHIGSLLFQFLDWVIAAVAGTSLSQILGNVQTSISNLIDNTCSSVVNLLNGLGNLTLREILQAFLTLILVVTDMILKVMNALIYLISGKDAGDWALQANSAVHTYGDELLAQAGATYQDVTHKSLGELATSIGDYSHHVGDELMAMMNSLSAQGGVENVLGGTGGDVSYLSAENVDAIATAVQTALTL